MPNLVLVGDAVEVGTIPEGIEFFLGHEPTIALLQARFPNANKDLAHHHRCQPDLLPRPWNIAGSQKGRRPISITVLQTT
jgi:hypothetical protein